MRKQFFSIPFILVLSFILVLTGCQREVDFNPGGGTAGPGLNDNVTVVAGMRGTVIDENNQPVAGATVTSGTNTTTTDHYGVFRFNNINISRNNGYVKVVKPGYFTGARSFVTTAGRIHNLRIRLLPKTTTGTFSGSTGGTVTLSDGGKLVMPANAVTDAAGNAYTGVVNIAMTWIDPTSPRLPEIVMGDLRGITTGNEERGLETYGMLGVEMTGPGGQALKIATGKTAELTFPLPASISGAAPSTIDLWHFDEIKGRWIQEGTATKTGNNYIAQVSHFSFWNCDAQFPLVNLCMTFVNAVNNQPLNNVIARIKRSNGSFGTGWTDSTGNLCGKVPKNEALILEVLDQCYSVVYSQNIGPFSADASLGTIQATLPAPNVLVITGTITSCTGANVTNGAVVIYSSGAFSYTLPVTNGTYSLTIIRCSGATVNFSVLGIDYATLQQSVLTNGSGTSGTVNMPAIQACGTSSAEFAEYIVDGVPYHFASPPDNFMGGDSTGTWGI
ncbi:MAG TPA: carboxypeptidase regulatory-like domain-containing protein, partial [Chitinophagaceae bacterium]|nr:carboxypeptidase regulatory-like domain-containing protein [Chitinophagaceae bacterium]